MKFAGKFLLLILSLSIISYGMSSSVYATSHNIPPISVETNLGSYATGDAILISGFVKDYDGEFAVTLMVVNPQSNIVSISQITPSSDGNFSSTVIGSAIVLSDTGLAILAIS